MYQKDLSWSKKRIPDEDAISLVDSDQLKISPNGEQIAVRLKNDSRVQYFTYWIGKPEKKTYINSESLQVTAIEQGFFFLTSDYLAIPMSEPVGHHAVIRTKDGTKVCDFDTTTYTLLTNTDQKWSPDRTPTAILDPHTNKIYDITLKTLMHLGATSFDLQPTDQITHSSETTPFELVGLP